MNSITTKLTHGFNAFFALVAIAIMLIMLTGCNSTKTETEEKTLPDGTKVKTVTEYNKQSVLYQKTFVTAGSTSAVKLESTGSTSSGTVAPNFLIGSGTGSIAASPQEDNRPVFGMSWSAGMLSSITNASASSGSLTYIGLKGETAEQTATRVNAIIKVKDATEESTEVETATDTSDTTATTTVADETATDSAEAATETTTADSTASTE